MHIIDTEHLSVDINVYPHSTIGAGWEFDRSTVLDGITTECGHMSVTPICHIREVFLVTLFIVLIATMTAILLNAKYIHLLLLHFS